MPLSKIQIGVLRFLVSHRDPDAPYYSFDIDVFHDREERVAAAAMTDAKALTAAGFSVAWLRQLPLIYTAEVAQRGHSTRLEWVVDSDYRFFPAIADEIFGYMLHPRGPRYEQGHGCGRPP